MPGRLEEVVVFPTGCSASRPAVDVAQLHLVPLLRLLHQYHHLGNAPGQNATLLIERKS
jgi:hypothetical protein